MRLCQRMASQPERRPLHSWWPMALRFLPLPCQSTPRESPGIRGQKTRGWAELNGCSCAGACAAQLGIAAARLGRARERAIASTYLPVRVQRGRVMPIPRALRDAARCTWARDGHIRAQWHCTAEALCGRQHTTFVGVPRLRLCTFVCTAALSPTCHTSACECACARVCLVRMCLVRVCVCV